MNTTEISTEQTSNIPSTNGNGHKMHFDILKEAKDQGIAKSYREIARKLKLSPTGLSNIVNGRSGGSAQTKRKIERLFGKPLEKLGDGTPAMKSTQAKPAQKRQAPKVQQQAKPAIADMVVDAPLTIEDAYRIASLFNPAIKEAAKATLQKALNEISAGS